MVEVSLQLLKGQAPQDYLMEVRVECRKDHDDVESRRSVLFIQISGYEGNLSLWATYLWTASTEEGERRLWRSNATLFG